MINFIPIIIAILVAASYAPGGASAAPGAALALSAGVAFCLTSLLLAWLIAAMGERKLREAGAAAFLPRLVHARRLYWAAVLAQYAALVHVYQWPGILPGAVEAVPLAGELFSLLPFFVALFLSAVPFYRLERAQRTISWSLGAYLRYHLRQNVFPLVPYLVFSLVRDGLGGIPGFRMTLAVYPTLEVVLSAVVLVILFIFAPLFIRFLWPARPLEPGSLRRRLDSLAARAGVRTRRIYVWQTGGGNILNACVAGAAGFLRYIFLTDALMAVLSEEEVEAVFAHEVAHARHHHMPIYLVLVLTFLFGIFALETAMEPAGRALAQALGVPEEAVAALVIAALIVVFWWQVFGRLSRALEQQADLSGALLLADFTAFIVAIEKIAFLAGNVRRVKGWRHHSVHERVAFLEAARMNPEVGGAFLGRLSRGLAVLFALFVVSIAGFAYRAAGDFDLSAGERFMREARFHHDDGRPAELLGVIDRMAREVSPREAAELAAGYAKVYHDADKLQLMERLLDAALRHDPDGKAVEEIMRRLRELPPVPEGRN